jgi:hypothetical protein
MHISGVMFRVLDSSAVDAWFEPQSDETKTIKLVSIKH